MAKLEGYELGSGTTSQQIDLNPRTTVVLQPMVLANAMTLLYRTSTTPTATIVWPAGTPVGTRIALNKVAAPEADNVLVVKNTADTVYAWAWDERS